MNPVGGPDNPLGDSRALHHDRSMSPTLVLECSSSRSSWALVDGGNVLAEGHTTGRASGAFFSSLEGSWPRGIRPAHILVGVGPGSFSGIRVAIAAATGMARAWNCPVTPIRSTHALARKHADAAVLGIFSDAKRGQLFFTAYAHGQMTQPSRLIARNELGDFLAKCSLALSLDPLEGVPGSEYPGAVDLAGAWQESGGEPGLPLEPIYLHTDVVNPVKTSAPRS